MSNLYSILPKLLTWIIIDEVNLDLPCGVCFWCGELRTTVSYITENIVCVCYEHQAMILSEMIFIVAVMQNT